LRRERFQVFDVGIGLSRTEEYSLIFDQLLGFGECGYVSVTLVFGSEHLDDGGSAGGGG